MHEITFSTIDKPKLLSQVVDSLKFLLYFCKTILLNHWVVFLFSIYIILILFYTVFFGIQRDNSK
jgi:hypothetical protein